VADILTLAEARSAIRLPAADTSKDADIDGTYIPATTAVVEDLIGPVMQATRTYVADGGGYAVVLPTTNVVSITSVSDSGATLTTADYTADLVSGVVYRGSATAPTYYLNGRGTVSVTYVAGAYTDPALVPANIKLAARIILAHLWQADQQGFRPDYGGPDSAVVSSPSGYAVPRRAVELLGKAADLPLGFA
jgi:hypothetical protein